MTAPVVARQATRAEGSGGAVAAGHPLAVEAALGVLAGGGNAVDAAVAAHAVLAVVMPDACGLGGDALFLVRSAPGRVVAVNGVGAAAAASPPDVVAVTGGASVTVPGAVAGWSEVLRAAGRLPLAEVLAPALALARDGFVVAAPLVAAVAAQRERLETGGASGWSLLGARVGQRLRQPELAAALATVATGGADAYYRSALAGDVAAAARAFGGHLQADDLAAITVEPIEPVAIAWDGGTAFVQPPSSQGVLLAMALKALDADAALGVPEADLAHVLVELVAEVFAVRDRCARDGRALLDLPLAPAPARASRRSGPRDYLHTTGVAVADSGGVIVSSLLSVFDDFGSGVFVPSGGFVLNNRAGGFTSGANAAGPSRLPVHTLAPALVEHDGEVLALATPGADAQVQSLLQVLASTRRGVQLREAVTAPRWRSSGGRVLAEAAHPLAAALAARGHDVVAVPDGADVVGSVVAAGTGPGGPYAVADWRRQSASGAIA